MTKKDLYKPLLPINLQFFAEEIEESDPTKDEGEGEPKLITLTEEELQEKLQREADRRVTEALKKREEKLRKEMEERIEKERKEAEELAKLSAEERAKVERERKEMELQKEREKLEQEKKKFYRERLELQTTKTLQERKLPTSFAKFVMGDDAESTLENIVEFEKQWQEALELEVNKRLGSASLPKTGQKGGVGFNPWAKDTFNLTEQGKLVRENPEYAKKLAAQAGVTLKF